MNSEAEELIEAYRVWLNDLIVKNDDEGVIPLVTREMFDEWDDPPRVLLDEVLMKDSIYARRHMVIICSPYHDEGGPTILTGIYELDFNDENWVLSEALAEFDTDTEVIWHNQKSTREGNG